MTRLNIGAGGQIRQGWVNIDRAWPDDLSTTVDNCGNVLARTHDPRSDDAWLMTCDLAEPLPFDDGTAQIAVAHHSLCMLAEADLHALLGEVYRVLESGGILRVSSVDFQYAIRATARRDAQWFAYLGVPEVVKDTFSDAAGAGQEVDFARMLAWYLDWGGARRTVLVSPEHFGIEYLAPAGFAWEQVAMNETTGPPDICDFDSRENESWFLEARKP